MTNEADSYVNFVEHPRYGRGPQFTGLNPQTEYGGATFLHWHSPAKCRIPNTAIPADLTRQTASTVPVTHYYDVTRQCRDCNRPFIFFAQEQKHWYEELGFGIDADCTRCFECRKHQQGIALKRERYEELFHREDKSEQELLEMGKCCLSLIEAGVFTSRQTQTVRKILNQLRQTSDKGIQELLAAMMERVLIIESKATK